MKRTVSTDAAPAAIGAYSQATVAAGLVFTAGQIPLTPDGDLLADAPVDEQTRRCLDNVAGILDAEGLGMRDVVKVTVYLDDIDDFDEMNAAYETYFPEEPPARSAVEVGNVPRGAAVEIAAIAAED